MLTCSRTHTANVERDCATGRKTINEYQVIEEIGRGQHGKVKLARDSINDNMVAIKIIPRLSKTRRLGKVSAADPQQNTKREIAILKKIRHENVVALLEVIDDPELQKIYMVLEHVERGEIVWRKKGLPNICYFERYRIEKGMHGEVLLPGEHTWSDVVDRKATVRALREASANNLLAPVNRWTTEFGVTANDDDNGQLPWWFVVDNSPELDPPPLASPATSRDTSRGPSRVASSTSVMSVPTPASYDSDPSPLSMMVQDGDSGAATPSLLHPSHAAASALEGSMYGPYTDDSAGLRRRSPSMADSIFSHMSSLDFNSVVHDPYADDFSYVPCFSIDQARTTFRDTVLGLEYLHYHGVVHRDIKPANLLWTRNFRVKISDFGVSYFGRPIRDGEQNIPVSEAEARNFDDDRELSKTVGTPAFFAPELCYTDLDQEPPRVSEQIDVWSLGVTLYCLIFARIPFLAEDEFSMFRKIATEEPYIPGSRLRPVGIFTDPTGSSLYQRTNVLPYRNDADPEYEELSESLLDLLRKMLVKNPEQRIRLRDVKRHEWVTEDIGDVDTWLEITDPARSQERRIQVDDAEIGEAVVPLNFLQRARSIVKRAVDKVIHGRSERDDSIATTSRRRANSSAASSLAEASVSQLSIFNIAGTGGGNNNNHGHGHSRSHSHNFHIHTGSHTRDERRPSLRGEDYFATVTQMPSEHPLAHSVTASPYGSPGEITPSSESAQRLMSADVLPTEPQPETPGPQPAGFFVDGAVDDSSDSSSPLSMRHTHSRSITNGILSRDSILRDIFSSPATPSPADASAGSSVAPSVATVVRRTRDGRTVTDASFRARSVDRAGIVFSNPDKRASPVVGLSRAVAPGNLQLPDKRASASPLPSPQFFSPSAIAAYHQSESEPNVHASRPAHATPDERPATAHRVHTVLAAVPDRATRSASNSVSASLQPLVSQEPQEPQTQAKRECGAATSPKHLTFDREEPKATAGDCNMPGFDGNTVASSSCASIGALSHFSPLRSPGEATGLSSSTNVTESSRDCSNHMLAFQSDPSLPALLSGASSVSADVEGDFLDDPRAVNGTSLIDVADSFAPSALEKKTAMYPAEHNSVSGLKDQQEWGSAGAIPVELDSPTARSTPVPPHPRRRVSVDDDDQDSDSDGGLTMAKPRRRGATTSREQTPVAFAHGGQVQMARRRDTNTSIESTETAKKVPVHYE